MIPASCYNYPSGYFKKSAAALETAINTAPAYRSWKVLDPGSGSSGTDSDAIDLRYAAMPELTKQIIRENFPSGLVPDYRDIEKGLKTGEIEYTFTSGTTGDRVVNIWNQQWWDAAEASSWKLNSALACLEYPQKEAKLASSLNVGISCEEDLPMESRITGNKLYLNEKISILQWQERHFQRMAAELDFFKPVILETNPSLLARLAFWAMDRGVKMYSPAVIVFTYEFISEIHRKAIRRVFSSPLVSSFGTTETGFVLQECEEGFLHQNIDFCRIDFYPLKEKFGGPGLGRMLVTTFGNPWNTVIRFDTGDLVRLHNNGICKCGRSQGLIAEAVEGRVTNCTFTADGKLVTTMDADRALSQIEGLRDYHLEQKSQSAFELQIMIDVNCGGGKSGTAKSEKITDEALHVLQLLYGPGGGYNIKVMENILPGPAGKFRRTQCDFEYNIKDLFYES